MPAWTWRISRPRPAIDLLLEDGEAEPDIDSLGGLVVSLLGRVPQRGEIIAHPDGSEFQVLEADPRRVRRLRVTLPKPLEPVMTRIGAWISRPHRLAAARCSPLSWARFPPSPSHPLEFFPALLLGYAALVLLLDGADAGPKPVRRCAGAGWAFASASF